MSLVLRLKVDGTAQVVGAANEVMVKLAAMHKAEREASAASKDAAQQSATAQARLAQIMAATSSPVEKLHGQLRELQELRPFAKTGEQVMAVERAMSSVSAALKGYTDQGRAAAQIAELLEQTVGPVQRLERELENLQALAPFAGTAEEARAVEQALARTTAALTQAKEAADPLAVAARQDAAAFRSLADQLDPAAVAARKVTEGQQLLDKALAGQVQGVRISREEHTALSQALRQQHGVLDQTAGRTKLATHEITNLSYQVQDAATQLAGGQSPFLILMQQGPQAAMAVGGVSRAMSLLLTPQAAVAAGVVAVGVGFAMVFARAQEINAEARRLGVTLKALNPDLEVTANGLRNIAFDVANQSGVSRSDAGSAAEAIAKTAGIVKKEVVRELTALTVDMNAVLGGSLDEIGGKLANTFVRGVPGIKKLDEELNFLSATEAHQIDLLGRQGDKAAALRIAMDALERRFGGAANTMRGEWGQALQKAGNAWDAFLEKLGRSDFSQTIARKVGGLADAIQARLVPSPDQELQQAREYAERLEQAASGAWAGYLGGSASARARAARKRVEQLEAQKAEEARLNLALNSKPPAWRTANDLGVPNSEEVRQ